MEEQKLGALRRGEIIGGILYLPMYLLGSQILAALLVRALGVDLQSKASLGPVNLAFGLINLCVLVPIFFRYLRDQFRALLDRGWKIFPDTGLGLLQYLGLNYLGTWIALELAVILGVEYANANQEAVEEALSAAPWMSLMAVCVLAPPVEELLCRGLVFCGLYRRGRVLAYAVSMVFFAAMHVYSSVPYQALGVSLVSFIVYLPGGYVLARIYERSGSIWTAIFLHMFINILSTLAQSLLG